MDEFLKSLQRPFFYDMAMDNKIIYFSMEQYNALCRASLNDDWVEIIATFPTKSVFKSSYRGIYKWKDKLLLGPKDKVSDLLIYDISNSKFLRISNEEKFNFYNYTCLEYNEKLYFVSDDTAKIIIMDLERLSMKSLDNDENILENAQIGMVVRVANQVYIPVNKYKLMLMFDLEKEKFEKIPFPQEISQIFSMTYHTGSFYTSGSDKKVYSWNIYNEEADFMFDIPDNVKLFYPREMWFYGSFVYNDFLFLFPAYADSILKYSLITGKIEKMEISGEEETTEGIYKELENGRFFPAKYSIVQRQDNKVYFRSSKTRILYELNLLTYEIVKHDLKVKNIYQNQIYPPAINGIMLERYYTHGLKTLMENMGECRSTITAEKQNIGKLIESVMNQ